MTHFIRPGTRLRFLLSLLCLSPAVACRDATRLQTSWRSTTVEGPVPIGTNPLFLALASTPDGRPAIAFNRAPEEQLWYAERGADGGWTTTQVDPDFHVGSGPSLAFDSNGSPHVAYSTYLSYEPDGGLTPYAYELRYAARVSSDAGSGWGVTRLSTLGLSLGTYTAGQWTSLSFDDAGYPHIASAAGNASPDQVLNYTSFDGRRWSNEAVAVGAFNPALALGSDGAPLISFCRDFLDAGVASSHLGLGLARLDAGGWEVGDVPITDSSRAGLVCGRTSLQVDFSGDPHVLLAGSGSGAYAVRSAGIWRASSKLNLSMNARMRLQPGSGAPSILFSGSHSLYLMQAEADGGWSLETVVSGVSALDAANDPLDLAFAPDGTVFAAYLNSDTGELDFVERE